MSAPPLTIPVLARADATRPAQRAPRAAAGRTVLPARRGRRDDVAVAGPGIAHRRRQPLRRRPVRLVLPVRRHGGRALPAARPDHGRDERAAGHQRDVEHLHAAAGDAARPGHPAGRPAGQPHRADDGGVRRLSAGHVRRGPAVGRQHPRRRAWRRGVRVLPRPDPVQPGPLRPAVRGAPAADRQRRAAPGRRPRWTGRRGAGQAGGGPVRRLAGAAGGRPGVHQRGAAVRHRPHHRDHGGGGAGFPPARGRRPGAGRGGRARGGGRRRRR